MYHKPEQPASQNFSFGSFGADDFGSTFYASKPSAAIASAVSDGHSPAQVYQDGSDKVLKQHSQRGGFRGRGRGRGRSQGRSHSGNFGKNRQDGHADAHAPASVAWAAFMYLQDWNYWLFCTPCSFRVNNLVHCSSSAVEAFMYFEEVTSSLEL